MQRQVWQTLIIGTALTLALVMCAGCAPGDSRETPAASPTPTSTPEAPAQATPTPTNTVEAPTEVPPTPTSTPTPGSAAGQATPESTPVPLCPDLELEIQFHQESAGVMKSVIDASGKVPLSVDLGADPPRVSGEGEMPVTGHAQVGECAMQVSGDLAYQFEGEIVPGADGHPEVHLRGHRTMSMAMTGEGCGGGGGAPSESMEESVLRYEDGYVSEWTWSMEGLGVEGKATWVLHILCER